MVILVIALLVLGPQRIPEVASSLGKAIRSFRKATRELQDQINIEDEVRRPLEELRSALRDEPLRPRDHLMSPAAPPPVQVVAPPAEAVVPPAAVAVPLVQPPSLLPVAHTADRPPVAIAAAGVGEAVAADAVKEAPPSK